MKALILSLALAASAQGAVLNTTPIQNFDAGLNGSNSGPLTYALNNALTGTSSAAIDLSGTVGINITLTGTSQANVLVYFSNANLTYTTGATQMYIIQSPGSYSIAPKARYVSFYNGASVPTSRVSAFYYQIAPVAATINSVVTSTSTTAAVTAYQLDYVWANSITVAATTAGVAVNLSSVAQEAGKKYKYYFQLNGLGYWGHGNTATVPSNFGLTRGMTIAANVTPILDSSLISGQHVYFGAQAGTVQIVVDVMKSVQ